MPGLPHQRDQLQIQARGEPGTLCLMGTAIGAALRGAGRCVLGAIMEQRAKGAQPLHRPQVPEQDVEVVAALGQDHGAGETAAAPLASHVGVGHVPEAHVFSMLHGDDIAQAAGGDDVVKRGEEGSVAENVAEHQDAPGPLRGLHQAHAILHRGSHRLFQQHIVAGLQRGDGGADVQVIQRADEGGIGHLPLGQQVLPGAKPALRRDVVGLGEAGPSDIVRLGDGDEAYLVGVCQGVRTVGVVAPVASADQDGFNRLGHRSSPLAIAKRAEIQYNSSEAPPQTDK